MSRGEGTARRPPRVVARRRLMLFTIPLWVLAGVIGGVLVIGQVLGARVERAFSDGDYEAALNASRLQGSLSLVERWKPAYNEGTSLALLGGLDDAQSRLENALAIAGPVEACPVRRNLALVHELRGDKLAGAGDAEGAKAEWHVALEVLGARDPGCDAGAARTVSMLDREDPRLPTLAAPAAAEVPVAGEDDGGDAAIEDRIRRKLEESEQGSSDEGQPPSGGSDDGTQEPAPTPGSIEDIRNGIDDNADERSRELDDDRNRDSGGGGGFTDRPW